MTKAAAADTWTLDEWADGSDVSVPVPSGIVFPGASWATDTPANQGLDGTAVSAFTTAIGGDGVFIRNGYKVASWGTESAKTNMASGTKPITAMMLFFAQEEALITSPDDLVSSFGWSMISKDSPMTLAHLANMVSAYTLAEAPGQAFAYNDYGVQLFADTVWNEIFADTPDNVASDPSRLGALGFQDGSLYGAGESVNTSPRDLARIGWLCCQRGEWDGTELIPREYFRDYWRALVPGTLPITSGNTNGEGAPDYLGVGSFGGTANQSLLGPGVYGFGWWFNGLIGTSATRLWPSAPADFRVLQGHFGSETMVIWPDEQIVVACNSANWGNLVTDGGVASSTMDDMMALIAATVP